MGSYRAGACASGTKPLPRRGHSVRGRGERSSSSAEAMNSQGIVRVIEEYVLVPSRPALDRFQTHGVRPSRKHGWRATIGPNRVAVDQETGRPQVDHKILDGLTPELRDHEIDHVAGHQHYVERAAESNGANVAFDP